MKLCLFAALIIIQSSVVAIYAADSGANLNIPPHIGNLTPNLPSPQVAGAEIQLKASATDPENDTILYKFLLKGPRTGGEWETVRDWNSSSSWVWNSERRDIGIIPLYSPNSSMTCTQFHEFLDDFRNISDFEILPKERTKTKT